MVTPGFLAQSVFVTATQWSCAAGMARLAREQLRDPNVRAVKWIEGFFGGFVTFPAAALAAWIYQEFISFAYHPGQPPLMFWTGGLLVIILLVPLHEAYISSVAQRGPVLQIFKRMAMSLRPSRLPSLFAMGAMVSVFTAILVLFFSMLIVLVMTKAGGGISLEGCYLAVILVLSPLMAVYYLAWARFWQKSASVVPAADDFSP